ncbi:MAG: bifunctional diaminohydroxyphosphoribosylaminopyrimidine deaminase/5-amino-6-(5-phosphoribosylamino)uracil reductase RibD [Selenomonadaceae bacterium]|nr:bifunctional diaminohydroxyphosphoribosylaminopyrimidine deaminase/5-amino-6-(5-phosphoribosylamino)uracil reductase RibD [Selenomonadaceae bacterium]
MTDEIFMREALRIARNAEGRTSPNPLVGAVIVRDGKIIAEGWHRAAGTPHAEIHALNMAGELAKNSTLYVTLEPCSHFGRTPPCAKAIVAAGIKRVVAAMTDPNPKVAGRGFDILRAAGVEVDVGILEDDARKLNEIFLKYITEKLPFVTMKFACSLDGKIATASGESQWISGIESRRFTHHLRDINDAILVGVGTVLADNPTLTTRLVEGKNPVRVILDSNARTPLNSNVVTDKSARTIIAVTENVPQEKISALETHGVEIITAGSGERVDLNILMRKLAEREITSVLVEGGGTVHFAMIKAGLVDKIFAFIAPKIIGGKNALTAVEGAGIENLSDAFELNNFTAQKLGDDILIVGTRN